MKEILVSSDRLAARFYGALRAFQKSIEKYKNKPSRKKTHHVSVALRRFLSLSRFLKDLSGRKFVHKKTSGLADFRKKMGAFRDAQELEAIVKKLNFKNDFFFSFSEKVRTERKKRANDFDATIAAFNPGSHSILRHKKHLKRWLGKVNSTHIEYILNSYLSKARVLFEKREGPQKEVYLHQIRVRLKCYRYSLELYDVTGSPVFQKKISDLKSVHVLLGEAHDLTLLLQRVKAHYKRHHLPGYSVCKEEIVRRKKKIQSAAVAKLQTVTEL